MNEEKKKILDIFDEKVELTNPKNQKKQQKIKLLLSQIRKLEGTKNEIKK